MNIHTQKGNTFAMDIIAGLTVSFAALSLGAAFGTMSGRGAFAGMIGAAVIPIITSIFGGTRIQASGPTAPMTAVSALVVAQAYESFADKLISEQFITLIFILNAVFLVLLGLFRTGRFIALVPNVIILGFMNGIGMLIWADQIKRLFGLGGKEQITGGILLNIGIALCTLAGIYLIPLLLKVAGVPTHIRKYLPGMFLTIVMATILTTVLQTDVEHVSIGATDGGIASIFALMAKYLPVSTELYTLDVLKIALPFALQLTLLAYLDSLLTSLVIDRMTGEKTKQNKELVAQGVANGLSALFQGIPGAQATIRSVLLIKEGAQTRLAGIMVGFFALLGFLLFANYISLITSAVFMGVLFKAGLDVMDRDFPKAYFKGGWFGSRKRNIQLFFILFSTLVTVFIDLNVAVFTGTVMFYLGKKYWSFEDAEDGFEEVHLDEVEDDETVLNPSVSH